MQGRLFPALGWLIISFLFFFITACDHPTVSEEPTADAGANQIVNTGQWVRLDGSRSEAGNGDRLTYEWRILRKPGASKTRLSKISAKRPSFIADVFGTYTVQLIVNNGTEDSERDLVVLHATSSSAETQSFDHDGTDGACADCHNGVDAFGKKEGHINASDLCEACHTITIFLPAMTDHNEVFGSCSSCHDGVIATGKSMDHTATDSQCDTCHSTATWNLNGHARTGSGSGSATSDTSTADDTEEDSDDDESMEFDHSSVAGEACKTCHNGTIAEGKDEDHIMTTDMCDACHSTENFEPVMKLNHNDILGSCSQCHMPPAGHVSIPADTECNACHRVDVWSPLGDSPAPAPMPSPTPSPTPVFDHTTLAPGTLCTSCHDGVIASGKPAGHVTTSSQCDVCHSTMAWLPTLAQFNGGTGAATPFDHSTIGTATCVSCHDGNTAMGKSPNHISTTDMCVACHNTSAWTPVGFVDHAQTLGVCSSCHDGVIATGKSVGHITTSSECNVCHRTSAWN